MNVGNQIPRIRVEPKRIKTDGEGAALLFAEYGCSLDPWQRLVLDCWLGKDEQGNYTTTSAGLSCPRQNGKNELLAARVFYGMIVNAERILFTAHQTRVSKRSFQRLVELFTDEKKPEITKLVKQIRYTNGEERIELKNGGVIQFSARSRQAARGFDGISLVVFDEAQEVEENQVDALLATLSASTTGTRQIIYTGTPPYPGCPGDVFRRFRDACITLDEKGENTCNAWHEWSVAAENLEDIKADDVSLWYECNPALGKRLTEEFTRQEMEMQSKDGFCRERLGYWSKPISEEEKIDYAIDRAAWAACESKEPKPEGKIAYGVKFTADGSFVCLCGAVIPKDGEARISFIEMRSAGDGLNWLAEWLKPRYDKASCVVIDGRNGADVLIDKLSDSWKFNGSKIKPSAYDVVTAAGLLVNSISERSVTWYSGQEILNDSAITSTRRRIGQGWGFGGDNSAPIEACALALWGAKTCKRIPGKKMLIG